LTPVFSVFFGLGHSEITAEQGILSLAPARNRAMATLLPALRRLP
jgi:hypothetical protein